LHGASSSTACHCRHASNCSCIGHNTSSSQSHSLLLLLLLLRGSWLLLLLLLLPWMT